LKKLFSSWWINLLLLNLPEFSLSDFF
jgi:hypothetical protein